MTFSVTHTTPFASDFGAPIYRHLSWVSVTLIFLADFLTPLGFAHGTLYVFSLFIATLRNDRRWLLRLGLTSILLCSAGLFVAIMPSGVSYPMVIANRLTSLVAIGAALSLCLYYLRWHRTTGSTALDNANTQLKQERTEKWLNLLSTTSGVGRWWYDAVREELHWSPEVALLHGLPATTSIHVTKAINFYPEPYHQNIQALFKQCLEKGIAYSDELALETIDGRSLWVHTSGVAQTDDRGKVIAILGTLKDLTQNKHLADKLRESQQQLRHVLDTFPIIAWSAKADGAIDYFSPALVEFSGVPEEQLAEPGYWLTLVHPNDQDECTRTWNDAVINRTPYRLSFRIRRHDGEYRWHQVKADFVLNDDGHIIKWYGSAKELLTP